MALFGNKDSQGPDSLIEAQRALDEAKRDTQPTPTVRVEEDESAFMAGGIPAEAVVTKDVPNTPTDTETIIAQPEATPDANEVTVNVWDFAAVVADAILVSDPKTQHAFVKYMVTTPNPLSFTGRGPEGRGTLKISTYQANSAQPVTSTTYRLFAADAPSATELGFSHHMVRLLITELIVKQNIATETNPDKKAQNIQEKLRQLREYQTQINNPNMRFLFDTAAGMLTAVEESSTEYRNFSRLPKTTTIEVTAPSDSADFILKIYQNAIKNLSEL